MDATNFILQHINLQLISQLIIHTIYMMCIRVSLLLFFFFMCGGLISQALKGDTNMSLCIEKERQALLDIKANLTDVHGILSRYWGSQGKWDCCEWMGVDCDSAGHVIRLDLENFIDDYRRVSILYLFTGKISPSLHVLNQLQELNLNYIDFQYSHLPNYLGSFSNLQTLRISCANLSGPIPRGLENLSKLVYLDLSRNSLSGSIPRGLGNLSKLVYLDLGFNSLSGSIPFSLGDFPSLTFLDLSQNMLGGDIQNLFNGSMPNDMGQLSNLETFKVGQNSLNGSIPNFIGCSSLRILNMSSNKLSGNVPKTLGLVSQLSDVDFSSNFLEGVISEVHFLNLTRLDHLDLSFNSLTMNFGFRGRIPSQLSTIKLQSCILGPRFPMWLETQKSFQHLDISNAGISDRVPAWFWNLPHDLEFVNLSSNDLDGMLPDMGNHSFNGHPGMDFSNNRFEGSVSLFPALWSLNLSGNKFSGTLLFLCEIEGFLSFLDLSNNSLLGIFPHCQLKFQEKLVILNLSNNKLSGKIPSLGFLSNLESLYLRANNFVGEVPLSLSNCTRLKFLDLRENQLSGVIPDWIGEKLSKLYVLDLGSNRFKGSIPSHICWLNNLQVLDLSNNHLTGNVPRCFGNFTDMATASVGDDMTKHSYYSYGDYSAEMCHILATDPYPYLGYDPALPCCRYLLQGAYYLDSALVTWKGMERSFERTGLQLLKNIDLSRNNLSGKIPYEITSLYDLASLNLSINKLHGEIPKDMDQFKTLESLDLSRNEFSGHIPWSLAHLNFLSYLDLSFNNLAGMIPSGPQLQCFTYTSYIGNPQLCGPPLTPNCGLQPAIEKNYVEEDEDELQKQYYTGMGVGYAFGFLGICGALVLHRRFRYSFFYVLESHEGFDIRNCGCAF